MGTLCIGSNTARSEEKGHFFVIKQRTSIRLFNQKCVSLNTGTGKKETLSTQLNTQPTENISFNSIAEETSPDEWFSA